MFSFLCILSSLLASKFFINSGKLCITMPAHAMALIVEYDEATSVTHKKSY